MSEVNHDQESDIEENADEGVGEHGHYVGSDGEPKQEVTDSGGNSFQVFAR